MISVRAGAVKNIRSVAENKNQRSVVGSNLAFMQAIIEIPKGDDRRRHLKYDKSDFIDLGPTKDIIPINNGIMPIHYGFIPETLNEKEGDEIDVLVFSDELLKVGQKITIRPIALIRREDGDDKIVAVDESKGQIRKWGDIQKEDRELIEKFFSFHYKFLSIDDLNAAIEYIKNGQKAFSKNKIINYPLNQETSKSFIHFFFDFLVSFYWTLSLFFSGDGLG